MDCKETLQNLALYLDGELATEKESQVLEHIHECWHCAEYKGNEEKLKEMIRKKLSYKLTTPSHITSRIKAMVLD